MTFTQPWPTEEQEDGFYDDMMGSIANDARVGLYCSECGVYFEAEHNHPVLCKSCHVAYQDTLDGAPLPLATEKEL